PRPGPSMSAYTTPPKPSAAVREPAMSIGSREVGATTGTNRRVAQRVATATTGLMRKIARHETEPISQPPSSGPTTVASPERPDQVPIARPRSLGANDDWTSA